MRKRLLAIIATAAMVVAMVPSMVFADATTTVYTFDELQAAVADGGDIKLGADIGVEGDWDSTKSIKVANEVNLDLNGYTLYGPHINQSGNMHLYAFIVEEGGTLTLEDTSASQTGKIKCHYSGVETKGGTFILESGTIDTVSANILQSAIVNYGGYVKVYGGTIDTNYWGIYTWGYFGNADTYIEDGNFRLASNTNKNYDGGAELVALKEGSDNYTSNLSILGGTFSEDVTEFLQEGFEQDATGKVIDSTAVTPEDTAKPADKPESSPATGDNNMAPFAVAGLALAAMAAVVATRRRTN